MEWIGVFILLLAAFILIRYILLKRQIRNLSRQLEELLAGSTEKMLDLSLIDRDLERLAILMNRHYEKQRSVAALSLQHETHLKESIANISHDLRTPLTVIIGNLQLLEKTQITQEQRKRIKTVLRKSDRMKELIAAFYELSLLEQKQLEPQWERINFSNLLIQVLTENVPLLEKGGIQPDISLPSASVFVRTDKGMMERILQNLLTNAIRYTDGGLWIVLEERDDNQVCLHMENTVRNGELIHVDRMFDRFYTGDQSRHEESTGLGLAVVKELVEAIQGTVEAGIQGNRLTLSLTVRKAESPLFRRL